MAEWDTYPTDYRAQEIEIILKAARAGESVSVIGLSGAGKSNLLGFLAHRAPGLAGDFVLVDCNRLIDTTPAACWQLIASALGAPPEEGTDLKKLEALIYERLNTSEGSLCLLFDRFDFLTNPPQPALYNNLRVLRDAHKYRLTYVVATRQPLDLGSELAELFYAHTLWLGPLSLSDARWNVQRYAKRIGAAWDSAVTNTLLEVSGRYPSFLRAACEAFAADTAPTLDAISAHPAVQRRVAEFWNDSPTVLALESSGLNNIPLLRRGGRPQINSEGFTAKEQQLYETLQANPGQVCSKDTLIRAVWSEDQIFEAGVRDDSLAQLVRRLRVKIEPDPSNPQIIKTVPGRGYLFVVGKLPGQI